MNTRNQKIENLLKLEVASKSPQSCVGFLSFSLFIFLYGFNCERFLPLIKVSMGVVFLISILRIIFTKQIVMKGTITKKEWYILVTFVWINTIAWALTFSLASYELKLTGLNFILVMAMLSGFLATSLVTLAYHPILFLPFQFLLLLPQLGIFLYYSLGPDQMDALPLVPMFIMYFAYQLNQLNAVRRESIERFSHQLDLEQSYEDLKVSTIQLVHTSRLAALGEMSAGMAHEVNNPLAIISGSIQQIDKQISRQTPDIHRILELSAKIQNAVGRVTNIIRGLRHFSQQSDILPKAVTPLSEIIRETMTFCHELLTVRHIKLYIDEIPNVNINCHSVQVSQVLINLIKNAEDALENELDPSKRWIRISCLHYDDSVSINVSNGGPEIPEDSRTKIFQPFFTTKIIGKGTGLGLSISKGIMKEHGGDLVFEPMAEFTTFALQLPLQNVIHHLSDTNS